MYLKWQIDRGQLNHNWLQNGILVGLNHSLSIVTGAVRTHNVRQSLAVNILRWQERHSELIELLSRFENEMSPRSLFDFLPLCRCTEETKNWLAPIMHELWLSREDVLIKIDTAKRAYLQAVASYTQVCQELNKLPENPVNKDYSSLEYALRLFTTACENLSQCLSDLPQEIRCA